MLIEFRARKTSVSQAHTTDSSNTEQTERIFIGLIVLFIDCLHRFLSFIELKLSWGAHSPLEEVVDWYTYNIQSRPVIYMHTFANDHVLKT